MSTKPIFTWHDLSGRLTSPMDASRCALALSLRMARRAGRVIERRGLHRYAVFHGGMNIRYIEGSVGQ
jgi:hypothetical protein